MPRPSIDQTMIELAYVLARRATCAKLSVGCVLTDSRHRIIGSGYNGTPHNLNHCITIPCAGACAPKGSDLCEAVHAEQNALLSCREPEHIFNCYTTYAPCMRCTKVLLNTGCQSIIYGEERYELPARTLWLHAGRTWTHFVA